MVTLCTLYCFCQVFLKNWCDFGEHKKCCFPQIYVKIARMIIFKSITLKEMKIFCRHELVSDKSGIFSDNFRTAFNSKTFFILTN
jgi:uncharacterized protein YjaG (DUF416 family)